MKIAPRLLQRLFGSGNVPYVLVLAAAASAFAAGRLSAPPPLPVATAEASALILRTVLERPELTPEQLEAAVKKPIADVIRRYAQQGHVVLDVAPDEAGRLALLALPPNTVDITAELQQAIAPAAPATAASREPR